MTNPLGTYLHDHLAGSVHAIELLEFLHEQHSSEQLGRFAAALLVEIKADREVLETLAERVGAGSSLVKELTTWFGEKMTRLKLKRHDESVLGTFEALEFLELGIHGKWALWRALATVAPYDPRFEGTDFEHLAFRAEMQRTQVEEHRLELARPALLSQKGLGAAG
jgi:hypothetical protein